MGVHYKGVPTVVVWGHSWVIATEWGYLPILSLTHTMHQAVTFLISTERDGAVVTVATGTRKMRSQHSGWCVEKEGMQKEDILKERSDISY